MSCLAILTVFAGGKTPYSAMNPILEIAKKHGLKIVEDAAQAIGAEYKDGKRAGSIGDIGCFSFFPSKNLGALGDGGMVVCKDPDLADRLRKMRVHGGHPKYYHKMIGGNFRLDAIQAGVVNVKLKYLDRWTKQRQENAKRYTELFKKSGLIEKIGLSLPEAVYADSTCDHFHIYNQFVIRVRDRDKLRDFLRKEEIGHEVYYPVPVHLQECFKDLGYKEGACPEAERASNETLALPIYPELSPLCRRPLSKPSSGFINRKIVTPRFFPKINRVLARKCHFAESQIRTIVDVKDDCHMPLEI